MRQTHFHLRRGRLLDPASGTDRESDLVISEGRIARIGRGLATPFEALPIDAEGLLLVPGLIDLHSHLREPGDEYKESIESASAAAAAGGFAAVCAMPNTQPPNDNRAVTEFIRARAAEAAGVRVYPVGAVSKGLRGETLSDIGDLKEAGVVALSDDGRPVMNARLMRRALEYGRTFGLPVIQHAEDLSLTEGGVMNEGVCSTRAGLRGQPVTCEVTPHHLTLTDEACLTYDTATKVAPPLRTGADVDTLHEALADGTIDAVATDHAPQTTIEKLVEYDQAAFGMIGFETALPLVLRLVEARELSLKDAVERMTAGPARVLGLPGGNLTEGAPADVTGIDLHRTWVVDPQRLRSKSRNTPFAGMTMKGRAVLTIAAGRILHDERLSPVHPERGEGRAR